MNHESFCPWVHDVCQISVCALFGSLKSSMIVTRSLTPRCYDNTAAENAVLLRLHDTAEYWFHSTHMLAVAVLVRKLHPCRQLGSALQTLNEHHQS